jgi:competence protein ComEA
MDADKVSVGVSVAAAVPASTPAAPEWIVPPNNPSVRLPSDPAPPWPRSAQATAVLLLLLALALLAWHAWNSQRGRCNPSTLESGILDSPTLDLNQADRAQLLQLPGVGDNLARRIEAYREQHHGFRDVDELRNVSGIGPKMLEKLRPFLYVSPRASDEPAEPRQAIPEKKSPAVGKKKDLAAKRIDVNRAGVDELQQLPGIGPKLSQRILETRQKKPFQSVNDLRRVRGIGPKILERLRPHVFVESNPPLASTSAK